jgi:uncharacterized protein YjbJ (UPF0337 family)
MNKFTFDASWDEVKGKLRQKYGQLTDDDLSFAEGKGEEMLGRLRQKLGMSQDDLHSMLNDLKDEGAGGGGVNRVREQIQKVKTRATQAAGEVKTKATAMAGDLKAAATVRAGEAYQQARQRATTLTGDGQDYIRQNPREALLTAVAAGFVVGLLLRR